MTGFVVFLKYIYIYIYIYIYTHTYEGDLKSSKSHQDFEIAVYISPLSGPHSDRN